MRHLRADVVRQINMSGSILAISQKPIDPISAKRYGKHFSKLKSARNHGHKDFISLLGVQIPNFDYSVTSVNLSWMTGFKSNLKLIVR